MLAVGTCKRFIDLQEIVEIIVEFDALEELIEASRLRIGKVRIRIDFVQHRQTQPAEVRLASPTRHLVATVDFLHVITKCQLIKRMCCHKPTSI